ncbi:nucleolar protein 8 [Rhea pennata]|uniref:nucleolar protein 8 n=1 Tax=Rhea pennata TaxID=8795 RepID=UPI002E261275
MEKKQVSKRLYVGGLGHTVSKSELQERFGKFGRVLDAEVITRKDEQGNPVKTFAYISVSISETDLKKCMSILNKTKWKGGTLQIELAKESFLHRLAMEREEAKLRKEKPQRDDKKNILESLQKAGVVDFHMKAVPGTEVPGHKNWVVGKFGRVLPVLHLKSQQKNKIVKYDPSKYCHNLRKLEQDLTHVVPVSKLTWRLEGQDDSISKKRQGEFPVTKKPPKKMRQLVNEDVNGAIVIPSGCQSQSKTISSLQLNQRSNSKPTEISKSFPPVSKTSGRNLLSDKGNVSKAISWKDKMNVSDSNSDSEEEIRAMIKKEMGIQKTETNVETESDHLEIVGDDFELKYNTHWSLDSPDTMKKVIKGSNREKESMECDNGYDSADTDEIIAVSKNPDLSSRKTTILDSRQVKVEKNVEEILSNKNCDFVNDFSLKMYNLEEENIGREGKKRKSKISAMQTATVNSTGKTNNGESSYSESEEGESDTSSVYESMMQDCYRLDLTLDDLKALATENTETLVEEANSTQSSSECSVKENAKGDITYNKKHSKFPPALKKKCICPDDIVAALIEGEENADEESSKRQNNSDLAYKPFRGMGSLFERELTKDSTGLKKRSVGNLGLEAYFSCSGEESPASKNTLLHSLEVSTEKQQNMGCDQLRKLSDAAILANKSDICRPHLKGKSEYVNSQQEDQKSEGGDAVRSADGSEDESSNVDSNALVSQEHIKGQLKSSKLLSTKLKRNVTNENGKTSILESKELCVCATASKEPDTKKKQLQDNQRRLAALEERQKERELQKKLIQGALSNLDSQPASMHKHIIFNSDAESESEVDEKSEKDASSGNTLEKESAPKTSGRLFESSEDEQDDTDDERFKIKPQFEGKAGEKLLHLQSRFGTDERFRLDARFIESDSEEEGKPTKILETEEEELAAEKKKNLEILGKLLNINLEHSKPTKTATNAKKFKDINALRYDPTRQDHAIFERKPNPTEKESKAKRKKKREESEKLPEVSKEIYYEISVDLKELFGSSKSEAEKSEVIPWDKDDAEESTSPDHQMLGPNISSNVAQESSGFTFSFFSDVDESAIKEEPYVLETIKPVKVAWQEDPRFQDSSSEDGEEPEASENERDKETFFSLPQAKSARFFFFSKDDERLREGPKLFCRSVNLSDEKDTWENRRRLLLEG